MIVIESDHVPPTVNKMFASLIIKGVMRRAKSKVYTQWIKAIAPDFAGKERIEGEFSISILLNRKSIGRASDIDNRIKPILDALVRHGRVTDDHLCQSLSIAFSGDSRPLRIEIEEA